MLRVAGRRRADGMVHDVTFVPWLTLRPSIRMWDLSRALLSIVRWRQTHMDNSSCSNLIGIIL